MTAPTTDIKYFHPSLGRSLLRLKEHRVLRLALWARLIGTWKLKKTRQQKVMRKLPIGTQSFCILAVSPRLISSSDTIFGILPSHMTTQPQSKQRGKPTVGSDPTSWVTPAVSPTELLSSLRKTHADWASSENVQVRQANCNRWVSGSSFGYSMFEHSLQNRNVICSFFFGASPELEAGEDILSS